MPGLVTAAVPRRVLDYGGVAPSSRSTINVMTNLPLLEAPNVTVLARLHGPVEWPSGASVVIEIRPDAPSADDPGVDFTTTEPWGSIAFVEGVDRPPMLKLLALPPHFGAAVRIDVSAKTGPVGGSIVAQVSVDIVQK